jgi:2-C-methyl-D-erythritol 2,4-cyclodiphosphate synthase
MTDLSGKGKKITVNQLQFRVGTGSDIHELVRGRDLIIGGVVIDHDFGLAGHSDADVLIHAVCDALLGAAALGDIGEVFPDTDPAYKGIASSLLLKVCSQRVRARGYTVGNLDCTVFAQAPKLAPYKKAMAAHIAGVLGIDPNQVSIKATTTEHLGFVGRKEGIAAQSTVLITKTGKANESESL